MPNLVGKVASFAFFLLANLVRRGINFSGFQYGVGSHFGRHFEFESHDRPKYNEYHSIRFAKPELMENDTS